MTANENYSVEEIREIARAGELWVREFTVTAAQEVPWHRHSGVTDHCYALEGAVRVERAGQEALTLRPGQSCVIAPGTPHRLTCAEGAVGRYLLVQVGAYDFVKVAASS